jgi:hypothetical protein
MGEVELDEARAVLRRCRSYLPRREATGPGSEPTAPDGD